MKNIFNIMKKVMLYIVLITSLACTNQYQVLQSIKSSTDCIETVGCSWNDGVVHIPGIGPSHFTFVVQTPGELHLKFKLLAWSYQGIDNMRCSINVKFDGNTVFSEGGTKSNFKEVSLGKVTKGTEVTVSGNSCDVKDIMIIGNMEDNEPSQWDF